jgi:hypothetical protein
MKSFNYLQKQHVRITLWILLSYFMKYLIGFVSESAFDIVLIELFESIFICFCL